LACEDLVIKAQIASPKATVVSKLKVGDVLDLEVQTIGGAAVVVLLFNGNIAGGLAAPNLSRLRECIEGGTTYQATITATSGAQLNVTVEAV
jgi:hypothetical protein